MPAVYKRKPNAMPRGVSNRRAALDWIRLNHNIYELNGVVYFGDDDNTFHLDLFKEIRTTKKISMFPVGLVGEYGVSSPIIDKVSIPNVLKKFNFSFFAKSLRLIQRFSNGALP